MDFVTSDPAVSPSNQTISAVIDTGGRQGTVYLRIVSTGDAVAAINDIQVTGANSGQGTVIPAAAEVLGPGIHKSTITVTACTSSLACTSDLIGTPQTVEVTYTITGVTTSTGAITYNLALDATTADYTRTLSVAAYPS